MPRHVWSVLCERFIVDGETRSMSLIDVAEELLVEEALPAEVVGVSLELFLVSYWMRAATGEPEAGAARFIVRSPSGSELAVGHEMAVDLQEETRVQTVGRIEVLPLLGMGCYDFVVQYQTRGAGEWTRFAEIPLMVSKVPAA